MVFGPGRVQAYLFGSGWGERPDGAEVLARAADEGLPAVVDADGLKYLPEQAPAGWLLTPHAGELAELLGQDRGWVTDDPVRAVRAGVEQTGATVLLKGASQLVAGPGEDGVRVALPGPAWTAQAGSGDVLGGVCAALLAAGESALDAGQLGASVQAVAAAAQPGAIPPQRAGRAHRAAAGPAPAAAGGPGMADEERPGRRRRRPGSIPSTASAEIDLAAFRANIAALQDHVGSAALMVVVKADGYGHGMIRLRPRGPGRPGPAGWAWPRRPRRWRCARPGTPGRCWPGCTGWRRTSPRWSPPQVDVSAQSLDQISRLVAAAATAERRARVHLKIDTGLSRNGAAGG